MNQTEKTFCIIKFGKKNRLESLLRKGELYFNTTKNLNDSTKFGTEQGDENEGAEWIENTQFTEIKVNHPQLGEFKFNPLPNQLGKFTQYNHNYLTCSFFILTTKDFENSDVLKIDEKMLEFGNYALVIKKPQIFVDRLIMALEMENVDYAAKKVEYKDLNTKGRIHISPFIKKIEHDYQKEFRIIIKNQLEPKLIKIPKMNEISEIVTSKYIVESKWEVMRN